MYMKKNIILSNLHVSLVFIHHMGKSSQLWKYLNHLIFPRSLLILKHSAFPLHTWLCSSGLTLTFNITFLLFLNVAVRFQSMRLTDSINKPFNNELQKLQSMLLQQYGLSKHSEQCGLSKQSEHLPSTCEVILSTVYPWLSKHLPHQTLNVS